MNLQTRGLVVAFLLLVSGLAFLPAAENGYDLWLRYVPIADTALRSQYRLSATHIVTEGTTATITAAADELKRGLDGLLGQTTPKGAAVTMDGAIVAGTPASSALISGLNLELDASPDAYRIVSTTVSGKKAVVIASNGDQGVLYGSFHLLRLLQTNRSIAALAISEKPKIKRRLLNHWDNLAGTIERGYAGNSLWNWGQLPGTLSPRYTDYARACASVGLNGTVVNNVNNSSNGQILSTSYISKLAALAKVFRPYGIRLYISAYFNAPQEIGNLSTSDPLNAQVISWWATKANEIYTAIPDFGGFLVKANSEGQPGPKTYGRTHAEGANCLATALAPHGGVVIWRAFVYDDAVDADRMKRAYLEFKALDGKMKSNVIVQAKNGSFDFQPREPIHPIFGGLTQTHVGMEMQITLEYLGQGVQLVYMGPYWKEVLDFDTYAKGQGSTVGKVIDGSVYSDTMSCIAGVANTGLDQNWCGHQFHQSNWFAFGRLAWNHTLSSDSIAEDWVRMTWGNDAKVVTTATTMMKGSREACVNYMMPLGILGIFYNGHHYGPQPGYNGDATHPDWNSVYWHKADATGLGYNRTSSGGSNYVGQYFPTVRDRFNAIATTPPEFLTTFHHVSWDYVIPSTGRTFWDELCYRYCAGCQYVRGMRNQWSSLSGLVDTERFGQVTTKLQTHETDANTWRTTCLDYFKTFSKKTVVSCDPTEIGQKPVVRKATQITDVPQEIAVYTIQGRLVSVLQFPHGSTVPIIQSRVKRQLGNGMYIIHNRTSSSVNLVSNLSTGSALTVRPK